MRTEVKIITPTIAQEILKTNKINRPVSKKQVDYYAEQMLRGQWKVTGQGISISTYGNLMDGQHRLHAVIKSKQNIPFLVIYGVSEDVFDVLDQGKKRTGADVLSLNDVKDANNKAAFISGYLAMRKQMSPSIAAFDGRGFRTSYKLSNTDTLNFYHENRELVEKICSVSSYAYSKFRVITRTIYGSVSLFLILNRKHKEETVFSFIRQLSTGQHVECNTIFLLRERLINSNASQSSQLDKTFKNKLLAKTWNDYITGKNDIKVLNIDSNKQYSFV